MISLLQGRGRKFAEMANKTNTIYVLYPRGLRTGGPEALHQLVHTLRKLGQEAYLVAHPDTIGAERVEQFSMYDAPEAERFMDTAGNTLVVPEVYIAELFKLKHAQLMCWWLSIDYSPTFMAERLNTRSEAPFFDVKSNLLPRVRSLKVPLDVARIKRSRIAHVVQSSYAWSFIFCRLDSVPSLLSDYTPSRDFVSGSGQIARRPELVSYNPVKGAEVIAKVKKLADPGIEWRPIQGMTRPQVIETLQESGIYLDLGFHPGKDRMPREAALSGALTLVARRGSGAFYADVPLPWEHKISTGADEAQSAADALPGLIANLAAEVTKQDQYRRLILNEEDRFTQEVDDIFVKGRTGKDAFDYSR